jgi:glycosyltransferase involved in cell wall biosynthesis
MPRLLAPPQVTVIIPTFNRARYLTEAIQSVLGQTFPDYELIVVDDGSTDGTAAVLEGFGDSRLRVLRQENHGISAAMNAGLRAAQGEYIARLDSDDVWFPNLLAYETRVLDSRPDIGVVYARAQAMSANGTPREHYS